METTHKPVNRIRNDLLLIAVLLCIGIALLLFQKFTQRSGAQVVVHNGEEVYATFDLDTDTEYRIETDYGINHLVIRDGYACIDSADCANQLCVMQGAISKSGEMIVCLPHEIIVEIKQE